MADGDDVERPADIKEVDEHTNTSMEYEAPFEYENGQYTRLAGDKESLDYKKDWKEIKVADGQDEESADDNGLGSQVPEEEHEEPNLTGASSEQIRTPTSPAPLHLQKTSQIHLHALHTA